jgi:hypothetical protein
MWAIAACALACAPSAAAQSTPAPAQDAPAVVAGTRVTMGQARARAGSEAGTYEVRETFVDLVQARFIAGEAALRGISATPEDVQRAQAAEQYGWGGEAAWRASLKARGIAESEGRAAVADAALAAKLTDTITAAAGGDAQAWGRTFLDIHARWRAQTTCTATTVNRIPDWCGNTPPRPGPCVWYGVGEGCALVYAGDASKWGAFVDLADTVFEGRVVGTCDDEADRARARLRAYLKRTAPAVLRRTRFDVDCRPQTLQTRRRGDLFVVLHAIARIAAHVRRG